MSEAPELDPAPFLDALGQAAVSSAHLDAYTVNGMTPRLAVRPTTTAAVSAALRLAHARDLAVVIQGGRTAIETGNAPRRYDLALDTRSLDQVTAFEPDDFTATVQAGVRFGELRDRLAAHGQFLPLDPPRPGEATVGGVVALGRGGPRRGAWGTARDWVIGCTAVRGDGMVIHGGGRVVKNVSGYDLPRLLAGSAGTLACLTEISLKLRPRPVADRTALVPRASLAEAVAAGRAVRQHVDGLSAATALDAATAEAVGLPAVATLLLRAAGAESAIEAVFAAVRTDLGVDLRDGLRDSLCDSSVAPWQAIADREAPAEGVLSLRVGGHPAQILELSALVVEDLPRGAVHVFADAGLVLARLAESGDVTPARLASLRETVEGRGGSLLIDAAPDALREIDAWGTPAGGLAIMRRLKDAYDPGGILAPGRFVGGL